MEIRSHTIVYSKNKAKTQRKRESDLQTLSLIHSGLQSAHLGILEGLIKAVQNCNATKHTAVGRT